MVGVGDVIAFAGVVAVIVVLPGLLVAKVGQLLERPAVRRVLHVVTGTVLTALGVRLAFERR
jgi:threonine/homoserine/homoserine lactone efflux protein